MMHRKKEKPHQPENGIPESIKDDVELVVDAELEALKKKAEEYEGLWDKHLRTCAEFENARKRWDREKQEIYKIGNYRLIQEIVVIIDELEQALRVAREHASDPEIVKGVEMTCNKFSSILARHGLKPIEARGKQFDPHLHEIVGQQQTDEYAEHTVIEEVQKGYFLEDRVLRTAKVILAVPPEAENSR